MTTCTSTLANGEPCNGPALNNHSTCRHHQPDHTCSNSRSPQYQRLELPDLNNRKGVVRAIVEVIHAISERRIKRSEGGTLLYGLQLASSLMEELDPWGPDPEEMYDDDSAHPDDAQESIHRLEERRRSLRAAGNNSYVPTTEDMKGFMHKFECVNAKKLVERIAAKRDAWERQKAMALAARSPEHRN